MYDWIDRSCAHSAAAPAGDSPFANNVCEVTEDVEEEDGAEGANTSPGGNAAVVAVNTAVAGELEVAVALDAAPRPRRRSNFSRKSGSLLSACTSRIARSSSTSLRISVGISLLPVASRLSLPPLSAVRCCCMCSHRESKCGAERELRTPKKKGEEEDGEGEKVSVV